MSAAESLAALAPDFREDAARIVDFLEERETRFERVEPGVGAFLPELDRFDRLRREAGELARRWPRPGDRGPLFGVPVAVKDIFHVDGFETRAGSRVPAERLAGRQSAAVGRLLDAGALYLGKAATTEFAYFGPGPTRNPHDPARTPGGSSSGSAAAVGAGLAPLALGTQTIGSISRPASYCGVTGYKPTYERISRDGVVALSPSLDHVGAFTHDVASARLAASVLCEGWRGIQAPERPRLGVPDGPYLEAAESPGRDHFEARVRQLAESGFAIERLAPLDDFDQVRERHLTIVAAEAARVHQPWYREWATSYHPKTRELIERGLAIPDEELADARAGRRELRDRLGAAMTEHGVDVWISPAAPGIAPRGLDSTGDPVMNLPWSHAGLPTLALPAGQVQGMPMGLQLAAGWGRDEELFVWGEQIETVLAASEEVGA